MPDLLANLLAEVIEALQVELRGSADRSAAPVVPGDVQCDHDGGMVEAV